MRVPLRWRMPKMGVNPGFANFRLAVLAGVMRLAVRKRKHLWNICSQFSDLWSAQQSEALRENWEQIFHKCFLFRTANLITPASTANLKFAKPGLTPILGILQRKGTPMKILLLSFCLFAVTQLKAQDGVPIGPSNTPSKTDTNSSAFIMGALFSEAKP